MEERKLRLDRFLSEAGEGTRKEVKKLVAKGKVAVNGETAADPSIKIEPGAALVELDGRRILYSRYAYYMLNKPRGVISASKGGGYRGEAIVTDLIKEKIRKDLFPVGRLDKDTEGLLIITNDGKLAHSLLSPGRGVEKTYYAELSGVLNPDEAARIMAGPDIGDEKPALPCRIEKITENTCLISVCEGRYHEVKRLFLTEGLSVTYLKRISMGPLVLDKSLLPGEYRALTKEETAGLKKLDYFKEERGNGKK